VGGWGVFAAHALRRRSRLAVQSQPWAAKRMGGEGLQFAFSYGRCA
jgi:hypothetical protein